jgi:DNA-directed RNA polymerase specialized sigma24 family protein
MPPSVKKIEPLEQIARSADLLLRLKLQEMKEGQSQTQMILLLGGIGATGGEIAALLDVSRTTVDPILSKARASIQRSKKSSARPRKGKG